MSVLDRTWDDLVRSFCFTVEGTKGVGQKNGFPKVTWLTVALHGVKTQASWLLGSLPSSLWLTALGDALGSIVIPILEMRQRGLKAANNFPSITYPIVPLLQKEILISCQWSISHVLGTLPYSWRVFPNTPSSVGSFYLPRSANKRNLPSSVDDLFNNLKILER